MGSWGGAVRTATFNMIIDKHGSLRATARGELCLTFYANLVERGVWGRMHLCTRMAECLCCPPKPITTL